MIDILNHIDDIVKIRKLIILGATDESIKACDVSIAHNKKKWMNLRNGLKKRVKKNFDSKIKDKTYTNKIMFWFCSFKSVDTIKFLTLDFHIKVW